MVNNIVLLVLETGDIRYDIINEKDAYKSVQMI